VLVALVTSLRGELADSQAALARALEGLAQARERSLSTHALGCQTNSYRENPWAVLVFAWRVFDRVDEAVQQGIRRRPEGWWLRKSAD